MTCDMCMWGHKCRDEETCEYFDPIVEVESSMLFEGQGFEDFSKEWQEYCQEYEEDYERI